MFTGIIEEMGEIRRREMDSSALSLEIGASFSQLLNLGESVATNGVCLTVSRKGEAFFEAHVMPETLKKSNLMDGGPGTRVNLERALTLQDLLGGHLLLGHVDARATIKERREEGGSVLFTISYPEEFGPYLIPQGSVAVDGISLTVAHLSHDTFTISMIPHTLSKTTFQYRQVGDVVNIEFDLLGKYVHRLLTVKKEERGQLDQHFLQEHGFF